MNLPEVQLLGNKLPPGWRRPTTGLVRAYLLNLQEGLAPPREPHLYRPSRSATRQDLQRPEVQAGLRMLEGYVRTDSGSALQAVGMAYPQLDRASKTNLRVIAVQVGMPDLRVENRGGNVTLLVNASYTPVRSEGLELRLEACFSAPGIGVRIMRWKEITLHLPGKPPRLVTGTDAWILQHEIDHLDGILCTEVAMDQRAPLYYVPPEWSRTFFRGSFDPAWPVVPRSQYAALKSGAFDLGAYARFL